MKILLLNGSPKGKNSNTLKIANSFIEGLNSTQENELTYYDISKLSIEHCKGCFGCWNQQANGKCVINDDMHQILDSIIHTDIIIWSFPLYYFGMPSKIKAVLDRTLPLNMPTINKNPDGTNSHPSRYSNKNHINVLISSCGFASMKNNYEALLKQFEILSGKHFTKIICPEGELLRVNELRYRVDEYLSYVKQAGIEFSTNREFTEATQAKLNELLFSEDEFLAMANS